MVGLGISPEEAKLIVKAEGEAGVILLRIPDRKAGTIRHNSREKRCGIKRSEVRFKTSLIASVYLRTRAVSVGVAVLQ